MKISWQLIQEQARNKGKEQAGNKGKALSSEPEYGNNPDGTYRATSACQIPTGINRNIPYTLCATVAHESLPQPIVTHIKQAAPQIVEPVGFTPMPSGNILCSVHFSKFYPRDILIKWVTIKEKGPELKATKQIIQTDGEETFDAVTKCEIPREKLQHGVRVTWEHESLALPQYRDLRVPEKEIGSVQPSSVPSLEPRATGSATGSAGESSAGKKRCQST
ncbi:uncharacterized protein LOC116407641 [Xenopus tropicalis]|uniref:Uncharacterized protein LOC116407641 n=1 Tax=Xenopus tropicalis TaxID=8364 RepID=A0A8J1IWS3_XENTR|nr:uncharacterized protein LOC116407641 [Xenopus tropicalis]